MPMALARRSRELSHLRRRTVPDRATRVHWRLADVQVLASAEFPSYATAPANEGLQLTGASGSRSLPAR